MELACYREAVSRVAYLWWDGNVWYRYSRI